MTESPPRPGKVWLVGAGPGDPDLITCRGLEAIRNAEVVLHDALSHPELLREAARAEIINVGKRYGERSPPQGQINEELLRFARQGKRVVRLKGGDPMLFARGGEEALALYNAGIPFEIVPGISSPVAAAEFSGIPLTHRDVSSSITFITGSDQEGHEWSKESWTKLATVGGTICVLMGMRRIEEITAALIEGGRSESTPVAVVQWAARPEQKIAVGNLANIAGHVRQAGLSNPAIIIVGEVVALREQLAWFDKLPLFGECILVPRPAHQAVETISAIRKRGAEPVTAPAIEIQSAGAESPLGAAVRSAKEYDWIVFTSQNGVSCFLSVMRELGLDGRVLGSAKIAVIGPKTEKTLRDAGIFADLVATEFVAETLAKELLAIEPQPQKVLLVRAKEAREVLPDELARAGVTVDVIPAYETRPVEGEAQEHLRRAVARSSTILLTSGSIVRSLVLALGVDALAHLESKTVVAIGPVTRQAAEQLGLKVDVSATVYTIDGALDALERYRGGKRSDQNAL
jgi:uroporphyrinogen III methyltransferase / synthase